MSKLSEAIKKQRGRDTELRRSEEKGFKKLDTSKKTPLKSNSTIAMESLMNAAPTDYLRLGKLLGIIRNDLIELEQEERDDGLHPHKLTEDQIRECLLIVNFLVDGKMTLKAFTMFIAGLRRSTVLFNVGSVKRVFDLNYTQVHRILQFFKDFELTEVVECSGHGKYIVSFNRLLREADFIFRDTDVNY